MKDMGVLAAGNLMAAAPGIGQQLQKQIGQTGIPVYNVANACATGATALRTAIMASSPARSTWAWPSASRSWPAPACSVPAASEERQEGVDAVGRYGAVTSTDGRIGTDSMPGVFAQVGMEYGHKYGGASFELFAKISEKNHATRR
jgi:acetyl-CoA acyltransferase